jgi:subtilisin family serine protease
MKRFGANGSLTKLAVVAAMSVAALAPATAAGAESRVLVRFDPTAGRHDRAAIRGTAGAELERVLPLSGLQVVAPAPGVSREELIERLERSGKVEYAERDKTRTTMVMPTDPYFHLEWGLHNTGQSVAGTAGTVDADIDAPEAWELTTGSPTATVAVVDSGIDYGHADLQPNIWTNPGESGNGRETNGVDDDGNGYVDDWRGWDWVDSDNDPLDLNGHGTHVAGTIGARGNDATGVAGVSWSGRLLPLRALDANGSGFVSDVIQAYLYASAKHVRIVNASIGGTAFSQAERDAIASAPGTLFVVAAGNDAEDNDVIAHYPCNYALDNVICVAATDQNDALADFSDYGNATVDLAAPGVDVASTWLNGAWAYSSGTSMATPHVAGAAGLVLAQHPSDSTAVLKQAILGGADVKPALQDKVATAGRLNAYRALLAQQPAPEPEPGITAPASPPPPPAPVPPGSSPPPAPSDHSAPAVTLRVAPRQSLRRVLRRGVHLKAACSEPCLLRPRLFLPARTARKLGLGSGVRPIPVERHARPVRLARTGATTLGLKSRAKRRLKRMDRVRLALRVRARDSAGNSRTVIKRLVLER